MHGRGKLIAMTFNDLQALLSHVEDLAVSAGRSILDVYATDFETKHKADESPVTSADVASEEHIIAGLAQIAPNIPVIAEESGTAPAHEREHWNAVWLIDPLDGTREFVSRNGEFSVNIGLAIHGRPVLGVVHAPVLGTTWSGIVDVRGGQQSRAWRTDVKTGEKRIISTVDAVANAPAITISRSHSEQLTTSYVNAFTEQFGPLELIPHGSAVKLCMVAEGRVAYYVRPRPTMEWDSAAGDAIVSAAGGMVVQLDGHSRLSYNKQNIENPGYIAAYSPDAWIPTNLS